MLPTEGEKYVKHRFVDSSEQGLLGVCGIHDPWYLQKRQIPYF